MEAWKRAGGPAIALVMIVLGVAVVDWANLGGPLGTSIRLAPLGNELCQAGACVPLDRGHGTWTMFARLVALLGGLGALAMLAVAIGRVVTLELGPVDRFITWICVTLAAVSGMALLSTGATLGELGLGGPLVVGGALVGLVTRLGSDGGVFGGGRARRPIRSTATVAGRPVDPYREAVAVAPPRATRAAPPLVEPERARPAPTGAPLNKGMVRLGPAAPVAADATRGALRFVVAEGAVTDSGLALRFDRGQPRQLRWSDVVQVCVRRMPPDPPYEKTAFLDLVLADGTPARLLPTTRLDLTALPGELAPNTKENWRRLVAHLRERNPSVAIEPESADFVAGGRDPVMFPAWKKFVEWDRRYDGDAG